MGERRRQLMAINDQMNDKIIKIMGAVCGRTLFLLIAGVMAMQGALAQEITTPTSQATVRLEAAQQRKEGDLFFADGKVEIQYKNLKLRADHMQYNAKTSMAVANGNVQLDVETQHLEADSA